MRNKIYLVILTVLLTATFAIPCLSDSGEYLFDSLSFSINAEAMGMGNAVAGYLHDASATFWNPAGIAKVSRTSIVSNYSDLFGRFRQGLVKYSYLAYAQRIQGIGSLGISWMRVGVEDIPITGEEFIDANNNGILGDFQDKNGNGIKEPGEYFIDIPIISGSFDSHEDAVFLSYAVQVTDRLSAGVAAKYLQQSILENKSTGWGLDIGISHSIWRQKMGVFTGGVDLAFVLRDLGTHVSWNTPSRPNFTRPLSYTFGMTTKLGIDRYSSVSLNLDYRSDENQVWGGIEVTLFKLLSIRGGYYRDKPTLGAGFKIPIRDALISFDYAYTSHDDLGKSQLVAASFDM